MNTVNLDRLVPEYIKGFEAYIPSKPDDVLKRYYGVHHLFRMNNNENALGPPAAARKVIEDFPQEQASIYPSGDSYHLRLALAQRFGLHEDQFLVGNGATEVISFVIKAFCASGDNIVTADKTFAVYEWVAEFSGLSARLIPLKDQAFDDRAMLEAMDEQTKVLFVCNPNNPTGTWWSESRLRAFLDAVGPERVVVVDEAYFEFMDEPGYPDGMKLLDEYPNLVVFRTFSKAYALAGLRIGYLAGSLEVVEVIRRTCVVYSVNILAQAAALAALPDEGHIHRTREMVKQGKEFLFEVLNRLGLPYLSGGGNYAMIKLPMSDSLAYRKLMTQGVMVRTMTGFRFPNWIRLSISGMEAMEAFGRGLGRILDKGARK